MTIDQYIAAFKKGWKLIFAFTAGFFILSLLYCVIGFRPTYEAKAKLLIQDAPQTVFVTDLGQEKKLQGDGMDKNPVLTQMEILSSYDMAARAYQVLRKQGVFPGMISRNEEEKLISDIQKSIKLKTPPGTDIITMTVAWKSPLMARTVANAYLAQYHDYNAGLNKQSITQAKQYIQGQLQRSRRDLSKIRAQLRNFRKANATVDIGAEATTIDRQIADMQDKIADLHGQMNYHHGKVGEMSSKLKIAPRGVAWAIDSVALGQNDNLNELSRKLTDAEQEQASLGVRYPDRTKKMQSLQESINAVKAGMRQQIAATVGKAAANRHHLIIKDSVRTKLVSDLIDNQAELISLGAQERSLKSALGQLQGHQRQIPDQQLALADLMERETNLASVVSTLNTKLIEASVRESEVVSNVNVVQVPTLPVSPAFPSRMHVVMIMSLVGMLIGSLTVLVRQHLRDVTASVTEIEELLQAPVFGTLSRLPESFYQLNSYDQPPPGEAIDYQRVVTALKNRLEDEGRSVIGLSSMSMGRSRPVIIASIARMLASCDYSVLLIDANFRHGTIAEEFGLNTETLPDFKQLMKNQVLLDAHSPSELQTVAYEKSAISRVSSDDLFLGDYMIRLEQEKPLYLLSKGSQCENPYEVVNHKFLPALIERVRDDYDFVLIDTPPLLNIPDTLTISRFLDGLVVLCRQESSREELKAVRKICEDNVINLAGAIIKASP